MAIIAAEFQPLPIVPENDDPLLREHLVQLQERHLSAFVIRSTIEGPASEAHMRHASTVGSLLSNLYPHYDLLTIESEEPEPGLSKTRGPLHHDIVNADAIWAAPDVLTMLDCDAYAWTMSINPRTPAKTFQLYDTFGPDIRDRHPDPNHPHNLLLKRQVNTEATLPQVSHGRVSTGNSLVFALASTWHRLDTVAPRPTNRTIQFTVFEAS